VANVLTQQGDVIILETLDGDDSPGTMKVKLFQNDHTPADADTEADYTEATFSGYAPVVVSFAEAGCDGLLESGIVEFETGLVVDQQVFASTGDPPAVTNDVYGMYIVETVSGRLVGAYRFDDAPDSIALLGDTIKAGGRLLLPPVVPA